MTKVIRSLLLLAALTFAVQAQAQNVTTLTVATCGTLPTPFVATKSGYFTVDVNGNLCTNGTFTGTLTPSGTQNVNLTQVLGAAPSLTNPLWVSPATGATFPVSAASLPLPTGAATQATLASVLTQLTYGQGLMAASLPVTVASNQSALSVTGTFWQATQPVSIAAAPLQPLGITPTDRTVTSATGASQQIAAANAARHGLIIQNTGNANCGVNPTGGTAVIGGAGTLTLVPQGSYQPRIPTLSAVTAICTAGQPLYAEEN